MKLIKLSTLLILLLITYFSLKTPDGHDLPTNDKVGHFLAYTILSIHMFLLSKTKRGNLMAFLFSVFYGILMEFSQGFVPGREQSFYDFIANSLGTLIGLGIMLLFKQNILTLLAKLKIIR